MTRSLRFRLMAAALIWVGFGLAGAGFAVSYLLRASVEQTFDARLDAALLTVLATLESDRETGVVTLQRPPADPSFARALSGWYWQVADDTGVQLRSRSLWAAGLDVGPPERAGSSGIVLLTGPDSMPLRVLVRDVTAPGGGALLRIAVAGPAQSIAEGTRTLIRVLWIALAIVGAGLIGGVALQTIFGLRPFAQLRRELNAVRDGRKERIETATFAEVQPLVSDLNALLAHNASILQRARTHVGNLAHGLKTPLSVISTAATPERDPDGAIRTSAAAMDRLIRHHLRRARSGASRGVPGHRTDAVAVTLELRDLLAKIYADRRLTVRTAMQSKLFFAGERQDFEEMTGNLLENAFKWAKTEVSLTATREGSDLIIAIADDGKGLPAGQFEVATEPGKRLDTSVPGDGFGLAIAQELAELYGGRLLLGRSGQGGLEARLVLPIASG
jgi:signal transduction histidine kinase